MRQETIIKTYLTFEELTDEQKQKVIENFDNDGFLYEHCMQERINTLKKFAEYVNGELDYSISWVPCRGEYINIYVEHDDLKEYINDFINDEKDCPLTGVCYDEDLREALRDNSLNEALEGYLNSIHSEYESMLTVEYIGDLCEANEYEFDNETLKIV